MAESPRERGTAREVGESTVSRRRRALLVALTLAASLALSMAGAPAFAQTVTDPPTDPPTSTDPSTSTEPPSTTDPATSTTEPATSTTSTTDPTTSTSEPSPTTTTVPASLDPNELLIPLPEFGALTSHQRDLVEQEQRATYSYATRRLELVDTERAITAAKGVLARSRAAEGAAITREVLELAQLGPDAGVAEVRDLSRRLDAATRRARATRQRAQDDLVALNDRADDQGRAEADALAERAAAESGLEGELGADAVRAKPDDITATLATAQAGQPDPAEVGGLSWPIPGAPLESPFGLRNDPLSNGAGFHPGVDVKASTGTEVHAAAAGRVVRAGDCGGYGNCVVIDHGNSVATLYGHLSQTDVSVGDQVADGDVIGLAGSTGWATGAHLHFEVRLRGLPIDPVLALGDTH